MECNQICCFNDPSDGCVKPHNKLCPMVSASHVADDGLRNVSPIWEGQAAEQREKHGLAIRGMYDITEDMLSTGKDLVELIIEAKQEAARHGIKADSIVINRNMVFVPEEFGERPAMVCGLNAYVTAKELPDGYSFAVVESQREKTNADRIRAMSDGEMANFFADKCLMANYLHLTDARDNLTATEIEAQKHTMYGILMKWLKQPADGDGHGKT